MTQQEIMRFVSRAVTKYGLKDTVQKAGVSETIIHKWRHNKCGMRMDTLIRLLDVWGYEIIIKRKGREGHGPGSVGDGEPAAGLVHGAQAAQAGDDIHVG